MNNQNIHLKLSIRCLVHSFSSSAQYLSHYIPLLLVASRDKCQLFRCLGEDWGSAMSKFMFTETKRAKNMNLKDNIWKWMLNVVTYRNHISYSTFQSFFWNWKSYFKFGFKAWRQFVSDSNVDKLGGDGKYVRSGMHPTPSTQFLVSIFMFGSFKSIESCFKMSMLTVHMMI